MPDNQDTEKDIIEGESKEGEVDGQRQRQREVQKDTEKKSKYSKNGFLFRYFFQKNVLENFEDKLLR